MAIYYVSTGGSDSGSGSESSPWRTIGKALAANLQPGDEIVVRPGTYAESVSINRDGSAAGYITLRSEVPGEALIRPPASAWNAISVNADYVAIDGFDIGGARGDGIEANNVHHVKVTNNVVHGSGESGIQFNGSDFILVEGNETYGNASSGWFSGISIYQNRNLTGDTSTDGFRTIVRNNISHDNVTKSGAHTDGNGIIIDDFRNTQNGSTAGNYAFKTLVENNLVYENGGKGIQVYVSDNVTVRNNTAWHNNQDLANDGTYRGELSNQAGANNVWANNIAVADPSINRSNTAVGHYGPASDNTVWANNLTFNGSAGQASVGVEGGTRGPTAAGGNLLGVDPQFVDPANGDFNLKPTSPGVDAGTAGFGLSAGDLNGGPRVVGTVDIGALETGSGAPDPVATVTATVAEDGSLRLPTPASGTIVGVGAAAGLPGPAHGSVTLSGSELVYAPSADYNGSDGFQYLLRAADGSISIVSVGVTVTPVNDAPVAGADAGFATEVGKPVAIPLATLLANDRDVDGDSLVITGVGGAVNGSVALDGKGNVVFTPAAGATGAAGFTYTVSDGKGGTATGQVGLRIDAAGEVQSVWTDASRPAVASDADTGAVELGMRFTVSVDGEVEALRFYKGSANGGTHTAHLWTADGELLASATFTAETRQGWQQVTLARPVALEAGETYVVSYHAPNGRYAVTEGYFNSPVTNGALTALDGVYRYGGAGSFPDQEYRDSNYWVDVVFDPADAAPNRAPGAPTLATVRVDETAPSGSVVGRLAASDPDGDALSFAVSDPRFAVNAANELVVADGASLHGWGDRLVPLAVTVSDGRGGTATATIGLTIRDMAPVGNEIVGTSRADKLAGGAGRDLISGLSGADTLDGGAGHDELRGGNGRDVLIGGTGADAFVFVTAAETGNGATRDVIRDFSHAEHDIIDLSGIDANRKLAGDQAFTFIGDAAFSGKPGELRYAGGIIEGDLNGDGAPELQIEVTGAPPLSAADFAL